MKHLYNYIWFFLFSLLLLGQTPQFTVGTFVQVIGNQNLNVRSGAAGTIVGSQSPGSQGKLIGGPTTASVGGTSYIWYNVDWQSGVDGWSIQDGIGLITPSAPTLSSPGNSNDPGPTLSNTSQIFSWNSVSNVTSYGLYIRDLTTNTLYEYSINAPTTSSTQNLIATHKYKWNMYAFNGTASSAISTSYFFQISGTDNATFVSKTIADGTQIEAGQNFTQNIRLRNSGSTTWTTGATGFTLNFVSGSQMSAPNYVELSSQVSAGSEVNFSISMTAPAIPGTYTGYWRMNSPSYVSFGDQITVQIVVPNNLPLPPNLISPGNLTAPGLAVSTFTPTFYWQSVNGVDQYGLYISKKNAGGTFDLIFDSEVRGLTIAGTSYSLPNSVLVDGGEYRWNMKSHNSSGWGTTYSDKFYFYLLLPQTGPTISYISPSSFVASYINKTMTINGSNFQSGCTLTFFPPEGGTIPSNSNKLTFNSSTQLSYQFNNGNDVGTWSVRVNNPDEKSSNTVNFTVTQEGNISQFLDCPIPNRTPLTALINSVFDHSMNSPYTADQKVVAYTGESGQSQFGQDYVITINSNALYGFKNESGSNFLVNSNYSGGGSPSFLYYDGHPGIDFKTTDQSADGKIIVLAAASGLVHYVQGSLYNTIYIDHGNGYTTHYLHLSQRTATDGIQVNKGDAIAISGDAGTPGSPHLHFEVKKNSVEVDPYGWLGSGADPYTRATNEWLWLTNATGAKEVEIIAPIVFALNQNYPNPFNPSTTIKYSVPKAGLITIKVYDVLGKEIYTLVNGEKSVGNYSIEFDGSKFSSGIYFYRMQAGSYIETKKLILLK